MIRPYPDVDDERPASAAAWRATVQERLDDVRGDLQAAREEFRGGLRGVRAEMKELRAEIQSQGRIQEKCMGLVSRAIDGVGAALALVARPTPGTLALAAMALIAVLALIGWSVVDVLTAADWLAGRVHVGETP